MEATKVQNGLDRPWCMGTKLEYQIVAIGVLKLPSEPVSDGEDSDWYCDLLRIFLHIRFTSRSSYFTLKEIVSPYKGSHSRVVKSRMI